MISPSSTPLQFDFSPDETLSGFRLHRLEVLNWGTFHRHVWSIDPNGRNALLTGDIGSGKSTLVDALTTLLVPHHRIVYNQAAGAEARERSLYSYVRGEYKREQDALSQSARAVALRDERSYSVLLAGFHNAGYDQTATLAQVFWLKPGVSQPERFFVFAEVPLSIPGVTSRMFPGRLSRNQVGRPVGWNGTIWHCSWWRIASAQEASRSFPRYARDSSLTPPALQQEVLHEQCQIVLLVLGTVPLG